MNKCVSVDCVSESMKTSISGVKICDHYVLTHGSLVLNLYNEFFKYCDKLHIEFNLSDRASLKELERNVCSFINLSNTTFTVVFHLDDFGSSLEKYSKASVLNDKATINDDKETLKTILCTRAYLQHVFIPTNLISEFFELFSENESWKFDKDEDVKVLNKCVIEDVYLSSVLILRINDGGNLRRCFQEIESYVMDPKKGSSLYIDGCPFSGTASRRIFLNSLSKGIISNVSNHGNIFLTDARCIIGCEGSPGYLLDEKIGICGIVVSPFCWFRGEWIGFTFMASLKPLLQYMKDSLVLLDAGTSKLSQKLELIERKDVMDFNSQTAFTKLTSKPDFLNASTISANVINNIQKAIVRVLSSNSLDWGSGFLVKSGEHTFILTCAHVVRGIEKVVEIINCSGEKEHGLIIFRSNLHEDENNNHERDIDIWDIAVIKLFKKSDYFLQLMKEVPPLGTELLVGGYPLFKYRELKSPTFTSGIIAKICYASSSSFKFENLKLKIDSSKTDISQNFALPDSPTHIGRDVYKTFTDSIPIMMQTTCGVYNGVSGGPVIAFHPSKGPVVIGVISCCARDQQNEVSHPHVNIAIPSYILAVALDAFHSLGLQAFEILKFPSKEAVSLWNTFGLKSKL